jgi:hypothetical protein
LGRCERADATFVYDSDTRTVEDDERQGDFAHADSPALNYTFARVQTPLIFE